MALNVRSRIGVPHDLPLVLVGMVLPSGFLGYVMDCRIMPFSAYRTNG